MICPYIVIYYNSINSCRLRKKTDKITIPSPAKDSSRREQIAHICGLRARIECEPLSEHSTHSDRVTNIGYCLFRGASVCLRNPELFLLPSGNSLFSAFLQLMSVNQVHDQDNKNNCD